MKAKTFKLVSLIVAILAAVILTVGYVFAWFFDTKNAEFTINGKSAGAYFDSGDGSKEKPFVIANPTHMHNLAVLQNTGKFTINGVQKQYYFEIKKTIDEIDMTEMYMPPIGNDEFPFIGIFNGNGKTVSNLTVTTNKSLLGDNYPAESDPDYKFSRAVGLFGMTGDVSDISNVILENPLVDVANENTLYFSEDKNGVKAAQQVAGIAVGFVAGKCSSIGVRAVSAGATLHLKVSGYSTFNSILGALGDNVSSAVTGGGHVAGTGGSGAAFGSSFDVEDLLKRLEKIDANRESSTPSWRLPKIDHQNANPVPDALRQVAFAVTEESTYEGADAIEVVSNQNIGYFLGNQNKIMTSKELKFDPPMTLSGNEWVMENTSNVPRWFYTYKTESGSYDTMAQAPSYGKTVFNPLTQSEFDELPQGILDLLPKKVGDKERFTAVRLSQVFNNTEHPFYNNDVGGWSFHGQISIMGKTYGKGFIDDDGKVVDENREATGDMLNQWGGKIEFYNYEEGIYLPNNAVWFKPQQLGKIKFVMYAEKMGEGFALVKITRKGATKDNPFYSAPNTGGWGRGDDIFFEPVMRTSLPSGVLLYFEHEIDADELAANNVEYMLMQYGSAGAQFLYLDLGASAAEDTSGIDREKAVSAVDFIYDGVEIKQGDPADDAADATIKVGDFIVKTSGDDGENEALYEASKTSVYFDDLSKVFKLVFLRLYSKSDSHTDKTKTICLEQSNPVPDKDSDIKATFATYVCPTISGGSGTVSSGGGGTVTPGPGPNPTPTPTDTVTKTADISGAKSANDVLLTVTYSDGNTIATATILCSGGAKTGGSIDDGNGNTETGVAHIQTSGSPCLEFVLAEGYTYTITVYAGSSGSGTRNITLNDIQLETGAGSVCKAVTWDNLTSGTYSCTTSGNIRIARIVITATPN